MLKKYTTEAERKDAKRETNRLWRAAHPDRVRATENRPERKAYQLEWRRRWREANRDEYRRQARTRRWRAQGVESDGTPRKPAMPPDERCARDAELMRGYRENPDVRERERLSKANYDAANRLLVRKKAREATQIVRQQAIDAYGGQCVRCGFSDPRALQFDHVAGNGYADRKANATRSPIAFYRRLIANRDSGEYQLLCANDNWVKRYENNELSYARRE